MKRASFIASKADLMKVIQLEPGSDVVLVQIETKEVEEKEEVTMYIASVGANKTIDMHKEYLKIKPLSVA